ncbi:flagellar protein FlaG [Sneathiella marina]|uniref:Flagellar protein FlaG n=1 Tax=Sneathiella marina TaxID=2950108 RepID=A0ABY4W184_9PROT|nr:flagellar protein FlaG [Sneathiella marina]USG59843.1 flagellar protein FlaG [Sneathiella marina]
MDVTPISKTDLNTSLVKSEINLPRPKGETTVSGDMTSVPDASVQVVDPVKRAERAIGPFFEDTKFPNGRFSIDMDDSSGRYVYRLVDVETQEVLKQFPGDYVLRRVAYYRELQGLAVNSQA